MSGKDREKVLHSLLKLGETLVRCGAEISRVEDTLCRMGKAYGASDMNVFAITSSIWVTMVFPDDIQLTESRRIKQGEDTNFRKLEEINDLSRRCCAEPMSVDALRLEVDRIRGESASDLKKVLGSIIAAGAFAVFFGGTVWDCAAAAFFAVVIWLLQKYFEPLCTNKVVFNLLASFFTGFLIVLSAHWIPPLHVDMVIIGDIMLLIPGMAITNSVRYMLVGDTMSGIMRFTESLLWAAALAFGFMGAMVLGGVLL